MKRWEEPGRWLAQGFWVSVWRGQGWFLSEGLSRVGKGYPGFPNRPTLRSRWLLSSTASCFQPRSKPPLSPSSRPTKAAGRRSASPRHRAPSGRFLPSATAEEERKKAEGLQLPLLPASRLFAGDPPGEESSFVCGCVCVYAWCVCVLFQIS